MRTDLKKTGKGLWKEVTVVTVIKKMDKLNNEVKKLIENLEKGKKLQIEYDSKNEVLKAWELKLHRIDLRSKEWINLNGLKKKLMKN